MLHLKFQIAKLLNTIGIKRHAKNIWDKSEKELKQKKWGSSNFQNTFLIDQGLLANKLEPKNNLLKVLLKKKSMIRPKNFVMYLVSSPCEDFLKTIN